MVPGEIPGIGSTAQRLRVAPGFDPLKAQVGPEEYFVLSRIDGSQTLREVLLATGLQVDRAVAIVMRLRSIGALLLPHETATPAPAAAPVMQRPAAGVTPVRPMTPVRGIGIVAPPRSPILDMPTQRLPPSVKGVQLDAPTIRRGPEMPPRGPNDSGPSPAIDTTLPDPTDDELRALGERIDLADGERRRILAMARLVEARDPYALLGVPDTADAKTLKRAYFKLSKDIHPDRYYGQQLGSFAKRIPEVFEAVSRAYARLAGPDKAKSSGGFPAVAEQPQTPTEYAAELFERACALEINGEFLEAMKLFAAAVRIDGQHRYLRRAASCALAAQQPKSALEYAKKAQTLAPTDASSARLLATAFRAAGKLADAEEVLVMAMALKNENDVLTSELRNDLAEVRRLLGSGS